MNTFELKRIVRKDGMNLRQISPSVDKYFEIAMIAINNDPYSLQFVPNTILNYHELAKIAVKKDGCVLEFVDFDTYNYEEICLEAVKNRWRAYKLMNKNWDDIPTLVKTPLSMFNRIVSITKTEIVAVPRTKSLPKICLVAVKQCGWALRYVPVWISNYEEICFEACKQDGTSLLYVAHYIENYVDMCRICRPVCGSYKNRIDNPRKTERNLELRSRI